MSVRRDPNKQERKSTRLRLVVFCLAVVVGVVLWQLGVYHEREQAPARMDRSARDRTVSSLGSSSGKPVVEPRNEEAETHEQAEWLAKDWLDEMVAPMEDPWFPVQSRINGQISTLSSESLEESLANLSEVEIYFWPGYPQHGYEVVLPLPPSAGQWDVHTIMSNRRFLKVFQELSSLREDQAAALLSTQIETSLTTHKVLLEQYLQEHADIFSPDYKGQYSPGFQIGNNRDGSPTFFGCRLQLLALTLLAGNLELQETRPAVMAVAQEGKRQRQLLCDAEQFNRSNAVPMLRRSLYNRQTLGTALLACSGDRDGAEKLRRELGLEWKTKRLTHYDAVATPYDLHGSIGAVPVDYSKGGFRVRYLGALDDTQFDKVMEWALSTGQGR